MKPVIDQVQQRVWGEADDAYASGEHLYGGPVWDRAKTQAWFLLVDELLHVVWGKAFEDLPIGAP